MFLLGAVTTARGRPACPAPGLESQGRPSRGEDSDEDPCDQASDPRLRDGLVGLLGWEREGTDGLEGGRPERGAEQPAKPGTEGLAEAPETEAQGQAPCGTHDTPGP